MRITTLLLFLLLSTRVFAQKDEVYTYPNTYYYRGVELYDEKKYNAAILQLQLFLENSGDVGLRGEAEYYQAVSKLYAEHSDGEAALLNFIAKNPGSHKVHMANLVLGDYYYLRGKYSSARRYYETVDELAISGEDKDRYHFRKGYAEVMTRKYKDAAKSLYPLTIKEGPYKILATYYYGYASYFIGNYTEALRAFNEIGDNGPSNVRLYIAQIYYLQGDYNKSLTALDKIASTVPKSRVYMLRGKNYYKLGNFDKAAENYNQSGMTADSLDKNEVYEFGYANYKTGNYSKSTDWFKLIAFSGDSLSQFASYNLGQNYLKLKTKREAANAFGEAYRTGFDKKVAENALFNQAKLSVELNDAKAATLLQRFIDNYPSSPDAKEAKKLLAKLMLSTDNYRDAVKVLESIGEMDASDEEIYQRVTLARGMELFKSRQWIDASDMFERSLQKKSSKSLQAQAIFWKAETLIQQGKYDDAGRYYQRYIDAPNNTGENYLPLAYYGLGYVRYELKRWADAVVYFKKFTEIATSSKYDEKLVNDAYLRLGDCNFMAKNIDAAIKAYAYVSGRKGLDADYAMFQTGVLYGLNKQPDQKISVLKRLTSDYPNSRFVPDAYFELGNEYLLRKKDNKEAERYYRYLVDDYKGHPLVIQAYTNLGRMYYNTNQDDKAIDMFTRLYEEYPGTPEARTAAEYVKQIYIDNGRPGDYTKWVQDHGGSITAGEKDSAFFMAANNLYEKEDYKGAIAGFDTYLNEMPHGSFVIKAHYFRGVSYENLKDKDAAIADYKVVADANGSEHQEDAVVGILELYGPGAACEQILPYLEKIESITKNRDTRHKAWGSMLSCYDKMHNVAKGRDLASRIGNELSAPDELKTQALVYRGKLDFDDKKYRSALDRFVEAYTKYNNRFAAEAKYREALVFYTIDSAEACQDACYQMLDQFNSYDFWVGKTMNLLGDAYLKAGDEFNAKATWNSVVESFSDPEIVNEAKEKLAKLKNKTRVGNFD